MSGYADETIWNISHSQASAGRLKSGVSLRFTSTYSYRDLKRYTGSYSRNSYGFWSDQFWRSLAARNKTAASAFIWYSFTVVTCQTKRLHHRRG